MRSLLAVALVLLALPALALARTFGKHYTVQSTAYTGSGGGGVFCTGQPPHFGEVAVPGPGLYGHLPCGTLIHLDRAVHGRRYFRVMDRIGCCSQLDFYLPSGAGAYGRRRVGYRVVVR